jgi:hypothetical protein
MPNRNCFPRRGCSFKVFADRVIESELAFLDKQHDSCGDELLTDRRDSVDGFGFGLDLELDIRQAIAFGLNDLTVFDDDEGEARNILLMHLGFD